MPLTCWLRRSARPCSTRKSACCAPRCQSPARPALRRRRSTTDPARWHRSRGPAARWAGAISAPPPHRRRSCASYCRPCSGRSAGTCQTPSARRSTMPARRRASGRRTWAATTSAGSRPGTACALATARWWSGAVQAIGGQRGDGLVGRAHAGRAFHFHHRAPGVLLQFRAGWQRDAVGLAVGAIDDQVALVVQLVGQALGGDAAEDRAGVLARLGFLCARGCRRK